MKINKILIGLVVILIVGLAVTYNKNSSSSRIVIGAVIPQTGFGAYWGGPVTKGIFLAEKDLQEKYGKENIQILVEDGKSDVPSSVSAAQKLININGVSGIYAEFSGPSSAISPIAVRASIPMVYSTFNQKIVGTYKQSLKTFISYEDVCSQFSNYIKNNNAKVLIVSSIGDAAPYCKTGLLENIPNENIKMIEGFVGNDFRTLLLQNREFAPDYILPIMYESGAYALIKQKYEMGITGVVFGYKQDIATEKILKELPAGATKDIIVFSVPIKDDFISRVKKVYPEVSDSDIQAIANSYQSVMTLGDLLNKCKAKDSECVAKYMSDAKSIASGAYKNAHFVNRVLYSDLEIKPAR